MTLGDPLVTSDDVRELNGDVLRKTAGLTRVLGTVMVVVGAAGALLWVWIALRQQGFLGGDDGPFGFGGSDEGVSLTQRIDLLSTTFSYLVAVALTAGAGMALRLAGQYVAAGAGGSLTAAAAGDALPSGRDDLPWLDDDEDGAGDDWPRP